jgi:hypothetical protein
LLRAEAVALRNPANDPALLDRLSHLVSTLEEERRRLAGRLAEIEEELSRLASVVASREDLRDPASPRR